MRRESKDLSQSNMKCKSKEVKTCEKQQAPPPKVKERKVQFQTPPVNPNKASPPKVSKHNRILMDVVVEDSVGRLKTIKAWVSI